MLPETNLSPISARRGGRHPARTHRSFATWTVFAAEESRTPAGLRSRPGKREPLADGCRRYQWVCVRFVGTHEGKGDGSLFSAAMLDPPLGEEQRPPQGEKIPVAPSWTSPGVLPADVPRPVLVPLSLSKGFSRPQSRRPAVRAVSPHSITHKPDARPLPMSDLTCPAGNL